MEPWFDQQTSGLIGALLGAGIGAGFGGIGGAMAGVLAPRGRAKPLVYGVFLSGVVIGILLAGTGLVALLLGQPRYVWYALGFPGFLVAVVMGSLFPMVRARYAQADQRRLDAESLRRE